MKIDFSTDKIVFTVPQAVKVCAFVFTAGAFYMQFSQLSATSSTMAITMQRIDKTLSVVDTKVFNLERDVSEVMQNDKKQDESITLLMGKYK